MVLNPHMKYDPHLLWNILLFLCNPFFFSFIPFFQNFFLYIFCNIELCVVFCIFFVPHIILLNFLCMLLFCYSFFQETVKSTNLMMEIIQYTGKCYTCIYSWKCNHYSKCPKKNKKRNKKSFFKCVLKICRLKMKMITIRNLHI